jgi:hypothetical protein
MARFSGFARVAGATALVACGPANRTDQPTPGEAPAPHAYRIAVGPEILVSRHPHQSHTELFIAANPLNANNLVATAMTTPSRAGGFSAVVFASHDGGNTWTSYHPPRLQQTGGSDPLVAFGAGGTAYFLAHVGALTYPPRPGERHGYDVYRSLDGGSTWSLAQTGAASIDHPMAAVDLTRGPRRGTLYLAGGGRLFRSTDDGRSLADTFALPPGLALTGGVMVLRDGSLVVALSADTAAPGEGRGAPVTVTSVDGGRRWSAPAGLPDLPAAPPGAAPPSLSRGLGGSETSFAADTAEGSRYRDRFMSCRPCTAAIACASSYARAPTAVEPGARQSP